jgi:predicted nucleotidyltransferase
VSIDKDFFMTVNIRPGTTFLGHPVTKLRTLLTSWAKGKRDPDDLAYLKSVALSPASVLALLGEAYDRGLIQAVVPDYVPEDIPSREDYKVCELSNAGLAVTSASASKRSPKDAAKRVLDKITENSARLASDPNALYCVDQIWVFGSYIDNSKVDVGDLDIVIERKRLPLAEPMDYVQKNAHIERYYPGAVPESVDVFWRQDHWFKKMVFGPRRHPLVSENTMDTLQALHQPCALVYDRSRGGVIDPEYFEHHPDSTGRSGEIQERLVLPDLDQVSDDFRMVSAEFYTPLFNGRDWHEHTVIVDKAKLSKNVQRLLEDVPVDGREHFAILVETGKKMQALLHVHRTVIFNGSVWSYDMNVKCLYAAKNADYGRFGKYAGGELLWTLFNADVVRLAARRSQIGGYQDIDAWMTMCRRSTAIPGLTDEISRLHERWFFETGECTHLPEDQRFGIMANYEYDGGGYTELFFYDDDDWSDTSVADRDQFSAWLACNDPSRYANFLEFHQVASPTL